MSLKIDMLRKEETQKLLLRDVGSMGCYLPCRESLEVLVRKVFSSHFINSQAFIKLLLSASTKESCHSLAALGFAAESL